MNALLEARREARRVRRALELETTAEDVKAVQTYIDKHNHRRPCEGTQSTYLIKIKQETLRCRETRWYATVCTDPGISGRYGRHIVIWRGLVTGRDQLRKDQILAVSPAFQRQNRAPGEKVDREYKWTDELAKAAWTYIRGWGGG